MYFPPCAGSVAVTAELRSTSGWTSLRAFRAFFEILDPPGARCVWDAPVAQFRFSNVDFAQGPPLFMLGATYDAHGAITGTMAGEYSRYDGALALVGA